MTTETSLVAHAEIQGQCNSRVDSNESVKDLMKITKFLITFLTNFFDQPTNSNLDFKNSYIIPKDPSKINYSETH